MANNESRLLKNKKLEKAIRDRENILIKELKRLLEKENPEQNDFSYSRIIHEQLVFLQQQKERIRYEKILEHFTSPTK